MFARHFHQGSLLVDLKDFFFYRLFKTILRPHLNQLKKVIIGLISTPHEQTWVQTQSHLNDLGL